MIPYDHIKIMIIRRFVKFYKKIQLSDNPFIETLQKTQSNDWRSTFGKNVMSLCRTANVNSLDDYIIVDIDVFPRIRNGDD